MKEFAKMLDPLHKKIPQNIRLGEYIKGSKPALLKQSLQHGSTVCF